MNVSKSTKKMEKQKIHVSSVASIWTRCRLRHPVKKAKMEWIQALVSCCCTASYHQPAAQSSRPVWAQLLQPWHESDLGIIDTQGINLQGCMQSVSPGAWSPSKNLSIGSFECPFISLYLRDLPACWKYLGSLSVPEPTEVPCYVYSNVWPLHQGSNSLM